MNLDCGEQLGNLAKNDHGYSIQIGMLDLDADQEMKEMGHEMAGPAARGAHPASDLYLALDNYYGAWDDYKAEVQLGYRKLQDLIRLRKRWAGQISRSSATATWPTASTRTTRC